MAYPYAAVESLQQQIEGLQSRLQAVTGQNHADAAVVTGLSNQDFISSLDHSPGRSNKQNWSDDIRKEAEEVGILAVGGPGAYSEHKYGTCCSSLTFFLVHC